MVVRIDISSLPGHLRKVIMKEIGFKHRSERVPGSSSSEPLDIIMIKAKIVTLQMKFLFLMRATLIQFIKI
jgi:hypothetical protein